MEEPEIEDLNTDRIVSNLKDEKRTKFKTGVVYLSLIPPFMSADILRRMLSKYAPIGRIFIQVVQVPGEKRVRKSREDTMYEGWVEFKKKRHAKEIAVMLNNSKMGGKKKSRFYDCLWNLKYLPRFKWVHLMERLNYEKAVMKQKLRAEISQAKRIANHFKDAVEMQEQDNRRKRSHPESIDSPSVSLIAEIKQRDSEEDKYLTVAQEKRESFLKSLFC